MYKNFKDMDAEMLHKMSWEVVEVFDSYLSGLGVMIPCDDFSEQKEREEENSDAALYGTEYWNLVDGIEMWFTLYSTVSGMVRNFCASAIPKLPLSALVSNQQTNGNHFPTAWQWRCFTCALTSMYAQFTISRFFVTEMSRCVYELTNTKNIEED